MKCKQLFVLQRLVELLFEFYEFRCSKCLITSFPIAFTMPAAIAGFAAKAKGPNNSDASNATIGPINDASPIVLATAAPSDSVNS